jgi:c-di-AMP phosphodiesterase-like protein
LNKTLRKLVEPGLLPYILALLLAAAAIYFEQFTFAIGAGAAMVLLLFVDMFQWNKREKRLRDYVESRIFEAESAKSSTLINFPLPIAIFKLEDSRIVWGNEQFFQMCGETGSRLDASISQLVP